MNALAYAVFSVPKWEREGNEVLGYVDFWRRNFISLSKFFQKILYPFRYFIKSNVCLSVCFVFQSSDFHYTNLKCKNCDSKTFITNLPCHSKLCTCLFLPSPCCTTNIYNRFMMVCMLWGTVYCKGTNITHSWSSTWS